MKIILQKASKYYNITFLLKIKKEEIIEAQCPFLGNDYIDKIKIITKYGGVSIGSSWLTKTFINVFKGKTS